MAVDDSRQAEENFEEYEHFLEDYSHFAPPASDEVLQGTVLSINAKEVIVDFGYKSEGLVPIEQFQTPSGEVTVKRGDVVDVMIDHGGAAARRLRAALAHARLAPAHLGQLGEGLHRTNW